MGQIMAILNQDFTKDQKIRIMPDVHAGTGCTIGTTMTIGDKIVPNLVGVDISCLDKDTEILTPNGWIKICDYDNSEILHYNYFKDTAFFDYPLAYIKDKCDKFYHFSNTKNLDQMFSSEHHMLVYTGTKSRGYNLNHICAKDFSDKIKKLVKSDFYTAKTTFNTVEKGINLSDDLIRLFVAISADGCIKNINKQGEYYIEMHFKKQRKIDRMIKLLTDCHIDYKISIGQDSTYITFKQSVITTKDLTIFYKANINQLKVLCDEIMYWDGTVDTKRNHKLFSTTNKINADVVQFAFSAIGIRSTMWVNTKQQANWNTAYVVIPTQNEYVAYKNDSESVKIENSIDGFKYCFATNTDAFVIRRNNKISVTGNCGMLTVNLKENRIDLPKFDSVVHKHIPAGMNVHKISKDNRTEVDLTELKCYGKAKFRSDYIYRSVGTLGGGNHFIELDKDSEGNIWLVIHTGSRNLGKAVCEYYQDLAFENLKATVNGGNRRTKIDELIAKLKAEHRDNEIQDELNKFNKEYYEKNPYIPYELCYVEGEAFDNYIHDMRIVQQFAHDNRAEIARLILKEAKLHEVERFETLHNYIDIDNMVLRKGAVSAQLGEKLIIPMNMKDGSLICVGKGNPDWNYSAPHGAGRLMSRREAKDSISMTDYKESMKGIYSTSVCKETIDESVFAYKPMQSIIDNIGDTVDIIDVIKPIYNFKAKD